MCACRTDAGRDRKIPGACQTRTQGPGCARQPSGFPLRRQHPADHGAVDQHSEQAADEDRPVIHGASVRQSNPLAGGNRVKQRTLQQRGGLVGLDVSKRKRTAVGAGDVGASGDPSDRGFATEVGRERGRKKTLFAQGKQGPMSRRCKGASCGRRQAQGEPVETRLALGCPPAMSARMRGGLGKHLHSPTKGGVLVRILDQGCQQTGRSIQGFAKRK